MNDVSVNQRAGIADLPPHVFQTLSTIVGPEHVLHDPEDLLAYGIDGTWVEREPQVVVLPNSAEEISAIVQLANAEHIVVTPRGSASGLSGGALSASGGIALSLTRMNRILDLDVGNAVAVVQPGVITGDLQKAVEQVGLHHPPDPSSLSVSAIGGNVAENAGGARCLKYGVTSDYVMALQVVLPTGEIIRTGGR